MIAGCELPIIACRSWCEGMEAGVEKRGWTGRKRMTGTGEDGEGEVPDPQHFVHVSKSEARCSVEGLVDWIDWKIRIIYGAPGGRGGSGTARTGKAGPATVESERRLRRSKLLMILSGSHTLSSI